MRKREARMFRHLDRALTDATEAGQMANYGKAGSNKGQVSR